VDQNDPCGRFKIASRKNPWGNNARLECPFGDRHIPNEMIRPAEKKDFKNLFPKSLIKWKKKIVVRHIRRPLKDDFAR